MNVVQTLNNRNNIPNTKLYTPHVTCVLYLQKDNVRMTYHISVFVQLLLQWKSTNITHSECVSVALVIQHAKPMHHIIFSSVASPPLVYHIFFHIAPYTAQYLKKCY